MQDITNTALIELSLEMASFATHHDRHSLLLTSLRKVINCDAVALLVLKGECLVPLAMQGLSNDTLGRRFEISEHPRFKQICSATQAVRFSADCHLPDPYDGLLIDREGDLPVHACMGLPLIHQNQLIGVITLDSLTPDVFDALSTRHLSLLTELIAASLHTAFTIDHLEASVKHSKQVVADLNNSAGVLGEQNEMIGNSAKVEKLKQEIGLVAPSDYAVLIHGDTGTGKELVAHAIHQQSLRKSAPLIYVNCAALPENLIESELFGHTKGAFTGAEKKRAGKFVIADGGTLFLDEIGELPMSAQSKLLRALQSNEIQPVGQDKIEKVDVRVIAATNRDLQKEIEVGKFRADLYHRINVFPLTVPALKERLGDIELLAGFFLEKTRRKLGLTQLKLAKNVVEKLNRYDWPGNVRELEHLVSRASLKAAGRNMNSAITVITLADFDPLTPNKEPRSEGLIKTQEKVPALLNLRNEVDDFQTELIKKVLIEENSNWSAAAKRLQTDRGNLMRLAKRLGLSIEKRVL